MENIPKSTEEIKNKIIEHLKENPKYTEEIKNKIIEHLEKKLLKQSNKVIALYGSPGHGGVIYPYHLNLFSNLNLNFEKTVEINELKDKIKENK